VSNGGTGSNAFDPSTIHLIGGMDLAVGTPKAISMEHTAKAGGKTDGSDQQKDTERKVVRTKDELKKDEEEIEEALHDGEPRDTDTAMDDPNSGTIPTGIQTGATTRGSYSTDQSTGGGGYSDHRSGKFGTSPIAQPSNDQEREPDPKEKGF